MIRLSPIPTPFHVAVALAALTASGLTDEPAPIKIAGMDAETAKAWWSFQPITVPVVPEVVSETGEMQNDIDRFILERLNREGVKATLATDRRTLIRRASYDLTGLPPTADEVDAFLADASPGAFPKVIERLLASPHYGEHWGRHWLDVVRYADTAGENTDRPLPHIWRYRNWVFEALNRDLPFDEFARLQIAGDILRSEASGDAYAEGIVATGYLALARRFGHDSDKDIHLMHEDVIDNLGKAFLGLALGCARCHDHKYDPVTATDYYALYGIFASSRFSFAGCEAKGAPRDLAPLLAPDEADALTRPWRERREEFEARLNEIADRSRQLEGRLKSEMPAAMTLLAADNVAEGGSVTFSALESRSLDRVEVRKGEILQLAVSPRGSHGADSTRVEWEIAELGGEGRRWNVADLISDLPAGNPHQGKGGAQWCFLDLKDGAAFLPEKLDAIDGKDALKGWRNGDTPSVFANTSDEPVAVWTTLPPHSFFVHPGPEDPVVVAWISPCDADLTLAGKVSDAHPGDGDGVAFRLEHIASVKAGPALLAIGELSLEQQTLLRARDANIAPTSPVAFAVVEDEGKDVRLQLRGDPEQPGENVPRRWLSAFGGHPVNGGSGRRDLAEWIVRNPLSTRVIVNRIWLGHFGQGLVRTPNDFGARGETPVYPELLEWLGARFEKDGRSLKSLHRLIMNSAAYQRASTPNDTDPENRLLSHFARRRLAAEEIRDTLLVVGGHLDSTPAEAHPFPPESTWTFTQHAPFNAVYDNNKLSAYQMVQRQRRHPFLALFDGADPNASTPERQTTTAPTQALFFLNDPFFHTQATLLEASLMDLSDDSARLRRLFRTTLQREPSTTENDWAATFLASYPGTPEEKWSACVRMILASNEFLYLD